MEPLAVGHDLGGLLRQVVVAGHHRLAAHEDLPILGCLNEVAGQGESDATDGILADVLDSDRSGRLGQAVTLDEGESHAGVEVREIGGQGCAAGDDVAQVGSEDGADLLQDERIGDAMAHLLEHAGSEGLLRGDRVGACLLGAPREHAALDAAARLGGGCVVDLFEDAGDDEEHGRLESLDVRQQVLDAGREPEHALAGQDDVHDEAGEHVGDREEEEQACLGGVDHLAKDLARTLRGGHEIRVREGDALGVTGRPRGVDDGCDIRRRDGGAALLDVLDGDAGGGAGDHALCAAIEGIDGNGVSGGDRVHELGLLRRGREDAGHVCVGEDVLDLGG